MATSRGNTGVTQGVDYTLTSGGVTVSGSFESATLKNDGQVDVVRNSVGDSFAKTYYDITEEKATFKFVTALNPFTPWAKGTLVTAAAGGTGKANTYMTGTNWIVEDYRIDDSNTTARRAEYDLSRNANITT